MKAGVAYSSFLRWQRQKRSLRRLVEEAERACCERERADCALETLLSENPTELTVRSHLHNRRPYRDPNAQPVKWMKLIQWWLVHRVRIDMIITPPVEAAACMRFKIPEWKWEEAKKRFPSLLPKVNQKRLRDVRKCRRVTSEQDISFPRARFTRHNGYIGIWSERKI
jgi:hypothetical protein